MAFLLKVFSGSDRLKEKQNSAVVVNETFRAELNDVQTKLEVENYELQMLVEMIYDSSYPESQKFLKQPKKDRLYAHKATISSLLFGLAAQGVSVAPLILSHFQKYGCDAIADTLIDLLELVRPLLASKVMPEHTSDDILDAIDNQWHSSVRSSPAFGSLRGSRAPSPLHSPRVSCSNVSPRKSFSNLSPRHSISSPQSPVSTERNLGSSPGQIPPYGPTSPRRSQSFSFSHPSSLPYSGQEGPTQRRSLSSHYPTSDVDLSGERIQPLAEHDEETYTGFGKFRERDGGSAELLPKIEADSCEEPSLYEAVENNALSRNRPRSTSTSAGAGGSDYAVEEYFKDFSTTGHNILDTVLPYSLNTGEHSKALSINIPRSSKSFEVMELNGGASAQRAPVADDRGSHNDDAGVKEVNETNVRFLPFNRVRSRSNSFDKPRLEFSHEQFDKSVRDVNTAVESEGSSARIDEDKAENILESDVPFRDSFSSSNCERQISEKAIAAPSTSLPTNHVEALEEGVLETNGRERNSSDVSLTFEKVVEGTDSEDSHLLNRASSPHYTEVEELGSSSWVEKSTSTHSEGFEYSSAAKGLGDNIQNEVDKAEDDMEKFLPKETNNEDRDGVVDGVEGDKAVDGVVGDGHKDGNSSTMIIPVVEDDNSLVSATTVRDKEESYSPSVGPDEGYLAEKSGVETEVEVQEQEPPQPRNTVDIGTDVLSQSSFSDHYDDGGDDESTSSPDDESSSFTSSPLEKRRSPSSPDDETDHESSLPSIRAKGTEETTAPLSLSVFDGDWHPCHVENGEHLAGNHSSRLLSSIDEDENKVQEAERTGLGEHVSNPDLDLPQGAELHTPSYNSVTFDLTKLSRDDNEVLSSCSPLQSEDGAVPDVTSKSMSYNDLDMSLANCFTRKRLASPSNFTAFPNTVATGASLLSLSSYEDVLVDDTTSEVVLSSIIDGFQNIFSSANNDAGVSTILELDSKGAERSLTDQKDQDTEEAGVVHSVAVHGENVNEEADRKNLSENETKELKNPNHSDYNLYVSDDEGESALSLQNVFGADLLMKDCEPQSPQQLPTHGGNEQAACVNDPPVSLSSDEVTHACLWGDTVEGSLPSKDLVQNQSEILSYVTVQEANDVELFARASIEASSGHSQLIKGFGDSPAMENSFRLSGQNEVKISGDNHSLDAQDEGEQGPPKTDCEATKSEDHLHQADNEEHEVPTFASLEARASADARGEYCALNGLSVRGEQYEANGSIQQSIEKRYGAIAQSVNYSVDDPGDFEVSRDTDEVAASPSEQDDEGVLNAQYGLNSADSKAEGDEIGSTEHVSNQLISTEYEGEPACSNGDDFKEHAILGTSPVNLSSTIDEEDGNSLIDEGDEGHDGIKWKKLEEGRPSHSVQFVKEIEVNDSEMSDAEHVTEANPLPARGGDLFVFSVNPSELALFESQSKENPVQEDVLQFPERDDLLPPEEKGAGESGAIYITPINICDGNMIYHVGHDHDEAKPDKEKDLVVHLDKIILPSQGEELEGQDSKQVLGGVNFSNTAELLCGITEENGAFGVCDPTTNLRIDESETSRLSEYEELTASGVPNFLADGYESSGSRGEHTLEHTHKFFGMVPAAPEETHSVKGMSPQFLVNSALKEKDEELSRKGTLLEEPGVALFKDEEVGDGPEVSNSIQTAHLSEALTHEVGDKWEINNNIEAQQGEKGSDTFLSIEELAMEGTREPVLHTLERGMELDEKDNHMGFITEPTTYGLFLHNTTLLASQGDFVRALTAPVTMARSTEALQSGPDRHSIRDSIICTPASSDGSSRTRKSVQQRRRYNFFRALFCTRCSSSSPL